MIIQFAVRTFGPILLRGGLGGGGASTTNTETQKADDDFDDFDDSAENEVDDKKNKVSISLPTFAPATPTIKSELTAPARVDLFDSFEDDTSSSTSTTSSVR